MTDGEALRRAVLADPDDDAPRLIYADWLEENGQSDRAAFVRTQVEAARAEPFGLAARALDEKSSQLLQLHRVEWTHHLRGTHVEPPRFERGFIEGVALEAAGFKTAIADIVAVEPVRSLRLTRTSDDLGWHSFLPAFEAMQMQQIQRLQFTSRNGFIHDEYTALLQSPNLASLRSLSFRGSPIQPSWLAELLGGDAFPQLSELDLAELTNLGPALLTATSRSPHRQLRALDVSGVNFGTSECLQRILASRCLQQVEVLRLAHYSRSDNGPLFNLDIGWVIPWKRLRVLELAGQRLGYEGVRAIVYQKEAAALRWLGLANNDLGPDSVQPIVDSAHLSLQYLDVRGNRLSSAHIAAFKARFPTAVVLG